MRYLRRILRYYSFEIALAIIMLYITMSFTSLQEELISALARKFFLWSAGLVAYYIARIMKVGVIEWGDDKKVYAIAILLYTGLVFALG